MLNGDGLRVVLWVAGCNHCCKECQNPVTWDPNGGLPFDQAAKQELFDQLEKSYISGVTFSGGSALSGKPYGDHGSGERDPGKVSGEDDLDVYGQSLGDGKKL